MNETFISEENLQLVRNWRTFQEKIKSFENKANLPLFKEIYGDDGYRLSTHFATDCKKNYLIFETYLTKKQLNDTLIYILTKINT